MKLVFNVTSRERDSADAGLRAPAVTDQRSAQSDRWPNGQWRASRTRLIVNAMSQPRRGARIYQLNVEHPLNALALACLRGLADADCGSLGIIELLRAHQEWLERSPLFKQNGAPQPAEVWSLLEFLDHAEPDQAMHFLTHVGASPAIEVAKLEELDGDVMAHKVLGVLIYQLALGAALMTERAN